MSKAVTDEQDSAQSSILTLPNFRFLWLGQIVSSFGDRFSEIAIPIFVLNLTGSALYLGLTFGIQTLATLLFGLLAGGLSDRWNRKYTLVTSDAVRAVIVFISFIIVNSSLSQNVTIILLYILTFLATASKQFFLPARISLISDLVPDGRLLEANSLDQASSTIMGFLGAAIAGLVVGLSTVSTALLIDCSSFVISSLCILLIRDNSEEEHDVSAKKQKSTLGQSISEGLQFAWQTPMLKGLLILGFIAPFSFGLLQPLLLLFARDAFDLSAFPIGKPEEAGDIVYGLIEGMFPLGLAFGAYAVGKLAHQLPRQRLLNYGVIGMGGAELIAVSAVVFFYHASSPLRNWIPTLFSSENAGLLLFITLTISLLFFFVSALFNSMLVVGLRTIVQEASPRDMIGRVFSIVNVSAQIAIATGTACTIFADVFGYLPIMLFVGVFLTVVGIHSLYWKAFSSKPLIDA